MNKKQEFSSMIYIMGNEKEKNIYYPTQIYFNQFQLLKCTLVTIFKSVVNTLRTKRRRR